MDVVGRIRRIPVLAWILLGALAVLLHGNGRVGLIESSEARYAEVAREMVATGDYVSPQIDYIYHFTKPPLTYWITAAGYHLFGENPFGARYFLALAAVAALLLTARLHEIRAGPGSGVRTALILATAPLFFAMGKVLTTDMFVTLFVVAGFWFWSLHEEGRMGDRAFAWAFGVTAGLGFLTKGPVPLLFWALALVPYGLWKDRGRCLRPFLQWRLWASFALVGLPWYALAGWRHPGLLAYLAAHESAEAAYSARRFHEGPWYYYLPVFLAGFFPWWIPLVSRVRILREPRVRLWLFWAAAPILVWTMFPSKLPTYILPTLPAWALLAAHATADEDGSLRRRTILALACLGAAGLGAAGLIYAGRSVAGGHLAGVDALLLGLSSATGLSAVLLAVWGPPRRAEISLVGALVLLQLAVPGLLADFESAGKIRQAMGTTLARSRAPDEPVLEYRTTLFSIPFYIRDRVVVYENNFYRKKYRDERLPDHVLPDAAALAAFIGTHPGIWVVTDVKKEPELAAEIPGLTLVMREGNHSLWASDPVARRLEAAGLIRERPPGLQVRGEAGDPLDMPALRAAGPAG